MVKRRLWSEGEYILTIYLYRFGYEDLGVTYPTIAKIIGRTPDSLIFRMANYLNAEQENVGLKGGGQKVKEIYNKFINTPKDELRKKVMEFLFSHPYDDGI